MKKITNLQKMVENLTFVVGDAKTLEIIWQEKPLPVFAEETIRFLDCLSRCIRKMPGSDQYPDLRSFAFWCRKQHLLNMKEQYADRGMDLLLGRGVSLHFVPSNIPLMFAYSMAAAMLAGNSVVMRLPSRTSHQEQLLVECLKQAQQNWANRILLLRYEHQEEVTRWLSARCDIRIVWGGNASVDAIRQCPLRADTTELTFSDRKSAAVLDAAALLELNQEELASLAENFYGDTYLYDQNSCASPSLIYWLGCPEKTKAARELFWDAVSGIAAERYLLPGKIVMEKWEQALEFAATNPGSKVEHWKNQILCVQLPVLGEFVWENTLYGGFFLEYGGENLEGLFPALDRTCQTLSYFGVEPEQIGAQIASAGVKGVDRIVPMGMALDFSLIWDGMDLNERMSRRICIQKQSRNECDCRFK